MKEGDIVCWQLKIFDMSGNGEGFTHFSANIKKVLDKYQIGKNGMIKPIAGWRIKKLKQ